MAGDHAVAHSPVIEIQASLVLRGESATAPLAAAGCVGVVAGAVAEAAAAVDAGIPGADMASAAGVAPVEVGDEVALALGDAGVVVGLADRSTLRGAVHVAAVDGCRRWRWRGCCWHWWWRQRRRWRGWWHWWRGRRWHGRWYWRRRGRGRRRRRRRWHRRWHRRGRWWRWRWRWLLPRVMAMRWRRLARRRVEQQHDAHGDDQAGLLSCASGSS